MNYEKNKDVISESRKKYYEENREAIIECRNKEEINALKRAQRRDGKTEEQIRLMDEFEERKRLRMERRREKKKKRNVFRNIIKRDIKSIKGGIITPEVACIVVSCEPSQRFLDHILKTNPKLAFDIPRERLKDRLIQAQRRALDLGEIIYPKPTVAMVLYHSSKYSQERIAKICGCTATTIRSLTNRLKIKRRKIWLNYPETIFNVYKFADGRIYCEKCFLRAMEMVDIPNEDYLQYKTTTNANICINQKCDSCGETLKEIDKVLGIE